MKASSSDMATQLEDIPNVGPAIAKDLRDLGIQTPLQLKEEDGIALYLKLNEITGIRHDPCVADIFIAAVDFMNGGEIKPWWSYTAQRKVDLGQRD
jgi:hypothetical protein